MYSLAAQSIPIAPATQLSCLIVDDEPQVAQALADCVRQTPALTLANTSTCPEQALDWLHGQAVDVVFLDIELPLLKGLRLLRALGTTPAVVLTSSYPDYNLQASSSYGMVDYLLKPIQFSHFQQVALRLLTQSSVAPTAWLTTNLFAPPQADGLYFWVGQRLVQVRLAEVLYVEDRHGCTHVKTIHEEFITDQAFGSLIKQLPEPQFLQVNSSFVVALHRAIPMANQAALVVGDQYIVVESAVQDELLACAFQTRLW